MMHYKLLAIFVIFCAVGNTLATGSTSCSTGPVQCCNQLQSASGSPLASLAGLLGLVLNPTSLIGASCTPITVLGAGGNSCSSQAVCCTGNSFNGLIALGCTPINLNVGK